MEKTYISVLKAALFVLLVIFQISPGMSYSEKRPNYSPHQDGTNFDRPNLPNYSPFQDGNNLDRPNFGGGQGMHLTTCVRNCQCWAQSDSPMQPVFVNCTSANKDTVPQVDIYCNYYSLLIINYNLNNL